MRTLCSGFAAIIIAAVALTAPKLSVADVTLTGDFSEPPCVPAFCEKPTNLLVGNQPAPVSGSLVVDGGSSLAQYHSMLFGVDIMTARGDMVVRDNSSVDAAGALTIGIPGNASLVISGGSTVNVGGAPIPFPDSSFFGLPSCFNVGIFGGSNGSAVVTDPGSELNSSICIDIGEGGTDPGSRLGNARLPGRGSLDIVNGASATTSFINVGTGATGIGIVNLVDGTLNILGTDAAGFGSFMQLGRSAQGTLTAHGSDIVIDPESVITSFDFGSGFNVGRAAPADGKLDLLYGSTLTVSGAFGFGGIGRRGANGEVNIEDGSTLIIEDATNGGVFVSPEPGSTGEVNIKGQGSLLDAGNLFSCGVNFDDSPGGSGKVSVGPGATLRAVTIRVGSDCKIKGKGTIEGNVISDPGAKISKKVTIIP